MHVNKQFKTLGLKRYKLVAHRNIIRLRVRTLTLFRNKITVLILRFELVHSDLNSFSDINAENIYVSRKKKLKTKMMLKYILIKILKFIKKNNYFHFSCVRYYSSL